MLHEARKSPYKSINKWLILQEILIKRIIYVENNIRKAKSIVSELNKLRKDPVNRLSKDDSLKAKENTKNSKYNIDEYRFILKIYKSIGDGIAFTFLHKFDIKPQNFKESPGFISEKSGIKKEKQYMRYAFKNGIIAIFNDITSTLKYADLILITPEGPLVVESKTSNNDNLRIQRQEANTKKIFDYLSNDTADELYGINGKIRRIEPSSHEINYTKNLNKVIAKAYNQTYSYSKVEDGVVFLATFTEFTESTLGNIIKASNLTIPFAFYLNAAKFTEQGYTPFSIIFNNPNTYWSFLQGELIIIIFIDFSVIERISLANGFTVQRSNHPNWAFEFKSVDPDSKVKQFNMSEHYFFRSFMEMVSVEWLLTQAFSIQKRAHEANS
ncbi:hypothetical protein KLP40_12520 [Hymenobacter sp. NST-14]|uniref:hypothetical protein n=1 Tax=Hymenobacter piscis TaxID=2839984 RepID=UPI001C019770|nr:hypothetical protein [Hymenobacter piscis]MBT9393988.1 hypothetical protein [Hymenobacter piscis]